MKFIKPRIALFFAMLFTTFSLNTAYAGDFLSQKDKFTQNQPANGQAVNAKKEVLSQFSTTFNKDAKSRTHNLKLSSIAIDEYVLEPGATFSFNEVVGYAGPQQGYEKAVIFVNGKEEKAYGGGICQVSSTLYNAALEAGLEIVERHPHSKEVHYVEKGKDAATSYGSVDLKFKNNFPYPVMINTYISDNTFTTEILK